MSSAPQLSPLPRYPVALTLGVTVVLTAAIGFAFRPRLAGTAGFYVSVALPYLSLAGVAVWYLRQARDLRFALRPRGGDITLGVVGGAILLLASWAGRTTLVHPDTAQREWLVNIYAQVGEPELVQNSLFLTGLVLLVVVSEELIWRGWLLDLLSRRFGQRRGWVLVTLLYAVTALPTLVTLASPTVGLNPLLLIASLFCGLVWSFLAHLTGRLTPGIIAHAVFTYFSIVQFRHPGL